jgi:hypothetical protein
LPVTGSPSGVVASLGMDYAITAMFVVVDDFLKAVRDGN